MELFFAIVVWLFVLVIALNFAQFLFGLLMMIVIGVGYAISLPFQYLYKVFKEK